MGLSRWNYLKVKLDWVWNAKVCMCVWGGCGAEGTAPVIVRTGCDFVELSVVLISSWPQTSDRDAPRRHPNNAWHALQKILHYTALRLRGRQDTRAFGGQVSSLDPSTHSNRVWTASLRLQVIPLWEISSSHSLLGLFSPISCRYPPHMLTYNSRKDIGFVQTHE